MEFITFACPNCQQPLKIPADKAGRKAKCNKCGNPLTIPHQSETVAIRETKPAAAPPRKPFEEEEDDGPALYGLVEEPKPPEPPPKSKKRDDEDEDEDDEDDYEDEDEDDRPAKRQKRIYEDGGEDDEEEEKPKEEVLTRRRRRLKGLRKAPQNPEQWNRVRAGMVLLAVSVCIGIAGLLLIRGVVLAGQLATPSYAQTAVEVFPGGIQPVGGTPGQAPNVDLARFFAGLLMGSNHPDTARTLLIVGTSLLVLQSLLGLVAYIVYIQVPPRYGTRGLAIALTVMAVVNLVLLIVLRLLPLAGVISYVLTPVYAMELPMLSSNIARLIPLHVVWLHIPMLEMFFGVLIMVLASLEAVVGCAFIRAVGISLRDEGTDKKGHGLMKLGMGTLFFLLFYQMAALAGTSEVLVGVLRVLYWLGTCFLLGYLVWYVAALFQTRTMIAKRLKDGVLA
jgi:hypothetical protein